jgi:hypothetical protein
VADTCTIYETPIYEEIGWVQRTLLEQCRLKGVKPGERISIPCSKLQKYCPHDVLDYTRYCGFKDFQAVLFIVRFAAKQGLIGMSEGTGKHRSHEYWLLPDHPAVRAELIRQGAARLKLVHSTH